LTAVVISSARLSKRSLAVTATFMVFGMPIASILRHLLSGPAVAARPVAAGADRRSRAR